MNLDNYIRDVKDFPKKGIVFKDITPLLQNAEALEICINQFYDQVKDLGVQCVVGLDARGFLFGPALALKLGVGFVPIRKKGKLPYETLEKSYTLEYGENTVEIHKDALKKGEKVLLIDDLLATGGTMNAAIELVEELGAEVLACQFLIELSFLQGREKLGGKKVLSLLSY